MIQFNSQLLRGTIARNEQKERFTMKEVIDSVVNAVCDTVETFLFGSNYVQQQEDDVLRMQEMGLQEAVSKENEVN